MLLLMALWLFAATPVDDAVGLVDDTRFEEAIPRLKALIYASKLSRGDSLRAREALARAFFFTQQSGLAKDQLSILLRNDPSYRIDSRRLSPDYVEFFDNLAKDAREKRQTRTAGKSNAPAVQVTAPVAGTNASGGNASAAAVPVAPAAQSPTPVVPATVVAAPAYQAAPWYLKIIPFGGGQFANHDPVGGAVFLVVEAALLGTNIGLIVANNNLVFSNGSYPRGGSSLPLYVAQQTTAAVFYGSLVVGLVDAFVWSPKRGQARVQATLVPASHGGAAMFAGAF